VILACPACGKRYALDPGRLRAASRLRCSACGLVFDRDAAAPAGAPAGRAPAADPAPPRGAPPAAAAPPPGGGTLVLLADEPREFRDLVARLLSDLGCRVQTTDDGEKAFRFAAAHRPPVAILNVYLKRLLGVAVCEGIKGSPDLRSTRVALVGTVFKSNRFVRAPGHLYGADDYFEDVIPEAELRDRLESLVRGTPRRAGAGRAGSGAPAPAGSAPGALDDAEDAALATLGGGEAGGRAGTGGEVIDPHAEIRRLARIMISDLKMYYPEELRQALLRRTFSESFREELAQARELIARRFPDTPDRMEILATALKEGLAHERAGAAAGARGA
jgi:CheY-like chemotaxis protein